MQKTDVWPNRRRFKELCEKERTHLGIDPASYWAYLAGLMGKSPRTMRSYAMDPNQAPGAPLVSKLAQHFGVNLRELERPSPEQRRRMLAEVSNQIVPRVQIQAPEPRAPKQIVSSRPENAERLVMLAELREKLDRLELVHLRFVGMLLEPYWGLFGIKA